MKNKKYQSIIYFVAGVVLVTLAIQFYWNAKNYEAEKNALIDEIRTSLDDAVDNYYISLAKNNTIGFFMDKTVSGDSIDKRLDSLIHRIDLSSKGIDSISSKSVSGIKVLKGLQVDTFDNDKKKWNTVKVTGSFDSIDQKSSFDIKTIDNVGDSPWSVFTSKIVVSITEDTLDLNKMDSILRKELFRRYIYVGTSLEFINTNGKVQIERPSIKREASNSTYASSSFLPKNSELNLYFEDIHTAVVKRIKGGLLLSTILIFAVIACLLFLLKIINKQKQIAEMKNDLISNITHEFKTPIATIGVALEGIESFNKANDPEKTKKYVKTSSVQLSKLNLMVEKLLETATLDSEILTLNKEEVNLVELMQNLIDRHKALATDKQFDFSALRENVWITADVFHLENALNNVLDNAVKYGGNTIKTTLTTDKNQVILTIEDNGKNLTSAQAKQIFEKFYRVPKGNQHDVKGFGIGLYYTKKIIEGHQGSITVALKNSTNFIITLPHG